MSIFSYHGNLAQYRVRWFIAKYLPGIRAEPLWPAFLLLITFTTTLLLFAFLPELGSSTDRALGTCTGTCLINSRSKLFVFILIRIYFYLSSYHHYLTNFQKLTPVTSHTQFTLHTLFVLTYYPAHTPVFLITLSCLSDHHCQTTHLSTYLPGSKL